MNCYRVVKMAFLVATLAFNLAALCFVCGCGPSAGELRRQENEAKRQQALEAREKLAAEKQKALSQVRTIHEKLDGQLLDNGLFKQDNPVSENDPWGNPIEIVYRKNSELCVTLIVRSNGPDGNPNNTDDIYKTSTRFRNDATKEEVEKMTRGLSRGLVSGVVDGITGRDPNKK